MSEIGRIANERIHDVVLALGSVAAHVELDRLLDIVVVGAGHRRKTHVPADEILELLGVQLAEPLEARDLAAAAALLDGALALLVGEAVVLLLLVAHSEKRSLENEHPPVGDKRTVEAHEKRREEHADMQPVDIGIGREDDLRIPQMIERVFDVQSLDEIEKLLVRQKFR